ncbi:MAG: hypothetical protein ACRDJC_27180 [Thermomicrobiales bacterium]
MAKLTGLRLRQVGRTTPRLGDTTDDGSGNVNGANGSGIKFHPSTQWG